MSIFWSILVAIGLCFDTLAVSVSAGIAYNQISFRQAVKFAFILAVFQGLMPFLGWLLGEEISSIIADYDHWVAFGLLLFIGLTMITGVGNENEAAKYNPLKLSNTIIIGFSTSIDALAVGLSFAFIEIDLFATIFIIGSLTFLTSMLGLLIGKKTMGKYNRQLVILGGLIIIGLGIKILVSHLWLS